MDVARDHPVSLSHRLAAAGRRVRRRLAAECRRAPAGRSQALQAGRGAYLFGGLATSSRSGRCAGIEGGILAVAGGHVRGFMEFAKLASICPISLTKILDKTQQIIKDKPFFTRTKTHLSRCSLSRAISQTLWD